MNRRPQTPIFQQTANFPPRITGICLTQKLIIFGAGLGKKILVFPELSGKGPKNGSDSATFRTLPRERNCLTT